MKKILASFQEFDASSAMALWLGFIAANIAGIGLMTMLLVW